MMHYLFVIAVAVFGMVTAVGITELVVIQKAIPFRIERITRKPREPRCNRPRDHVRWPHMHAANTSTSCWSMYGKECPVHGPNAMKNTRGRWTCPGQLAGTCQCPGNCGFTAASGHNCLCSRCTPAPAQPSNLYVICPTCGWHYAGPIPGACGNCGTAIGLPPGGSGGAGGGGGSAGGGGGGGGGGSGSWSHNTGGVPPGRSAGGSAGNSIMRRVTPRPPGRGAAAGMPGFTEQGELAPDFDLAIGSVRGLRQWNLQPPNLNADPARDSYLWQPPCMKGATGQFLWQPGVNEASCNSNRDHQPPVDFDEHGMSCGCGFWAYWTIQDLAVGGAMSINPNTGLPITGLIEGTGRVLIGEKGFRSQRAKIIAIAPAFSVQAYSPPDYGDRWGRSLPRSQVITDPLTDPAEAHRRAEALERENREAQQRADAWMAVIQDRLGLMYPDAEVYATLKGMLAMVTTGEIT